MVNNANRWPELRQHLEAYVARPEPGGLNNVVIDIANRSATFENLSEFVDLWLDNGELPDEQMAWLLANRFGPTWRVDLLQLLDSSPAAGRLLEMLADGGRAEGREPPQLGSGGGFAMASPPDLIDLPGEQEVDRNVPLVPKPDLPPQSPTSGHTPVPASISPSAPTSAPTPAPAPDNGQGGQRQRRFRALRDPADDHTVEFDYSDRTGDNILLSGDTRLDPAEIGSGLETRWEIASNQPLTSFDPNVTTDIGFGRDGEPTLWFADFDLYVPAAGNSEIRTVYCDGDDLADAQDLDIRIYAVGHGEGLLRHLRASLPRNGTKPITVVDDAAVSEIADAIDPPHHEFTTPPASLALTVHRDDTVRVHPDPMTGQPATTDIWPSGPELAPLIDMVRRHAEVLRSTHSAYFEAIEADELSARLDHGLANHHLGRTADWSFDVDDQAPILPEHTDAWLEVASSDEALDLAHHGYLLYDTCFATGSASRGLLDALPPGGRLSIDWALAPGNASVPWNLMYTDVPPHRGPIDANRFLGLRHRVSWAKWRSAPTSQVLGRADQIERLHMLYWNDDDIGTESTNQRSALSSLANHRIVPDPNLADTEIEQAIAELTRPTDASILHLYCHCVHSGGAGGSKLVFGPPNSRHLADYEIAGRNFGAGEFGSEPFVFVNACESAGSGVYEVNQIEQMFFRRGARAFMGTEVKVPIGLAARFAHIFFRLLEEPLDGTHLFTGEAAALTRRYLWLNYRNIGGLFYSYIHHYGLRMSP